MSADNNQSFSNLGRCISILDRLMKMYYDHGLADYEIGWGQQFYVEYLYDHPGATAQEMVEHIRVDKGTLTKVIKKLNEIGYLEIVRNETDKRSKCLYLTEQAIPAAKRIKEIHASFYDALCVDIPLPELRQAERTMERMTENINRKVWHRMEDSHGA